MKVSYNATIHQFQEQGEKTGWTYISLPEDLAELLFPGNKKSFRVKGFLDQYSIERVALLPIGDGSFILPLNATMRRSIKKKVGAMLQVQLQKDDGEVKVPIELQEALSQSPQAQDFFQTLKLSHRNYYINWVKVMKTEAKRIERSVQAMEGLQQHMDFGAFMQHLKSKKA